MKDLPDIPNKRYFTIGEAAQLCGVKSHVLRYWEQNFQQLGQHITRRGDGQRRYYRRQDIEFARHIRDLLHAQGFTVQGAKQKLEELQSEPSILPNANSRQDDHSGEETSKQPNGKSANAVSKKPKVSVDSVANSSVVAVTKKEKARFVSVPLFAELAGLADDAQNANEQEYKEEDSESNPQQLPASNHQPLVISEHQWEQFDAALQKNRQQIMGLLAYLGAIPK